MKTTTTNYSLTLTSALALVMGVTAAHSQQTDLMVQSLEFLPAMTRTLVHPEQLRFTLGNYGPDSAASVTVEYFLSRNQVLGDSDDLPIGSDEYQIDLQPQTGGVLELPTLYRASVTIPAEAAGAYYPAVRVSPVGSSEPDLTDNVAFGGSVTVEPLTNSAYAVFADYQPTVNNVEITPEFGFEFNGYYGNCWRIVNESGGFSATFNSPTAGECQLLVRHLTSSSAECPGDGYSPVSVLVNGVTVVSDFDPAAAHGGTHGYTEDSWKINVVEGPNTIQWIAGELCTHYWIQRFEVGPVTVPLKFRSIRPDGYGGLLLSITGQPGCTCILEASFDMNSWFEVTRVLNPSASFDVSLGIPANQPVKFFRAIQIQP